MIYYSLSADVAAIVQLTSSDPPKWTEEVLGESEEYFGGIANAISHPVETVESMAQAVNDTYEEEGLTYIASYVAADFFIGKVASGAGKTVMKKVADKTGDATDIAKVVDETGDATDIAKVVDKIGDATDIAKVADETDDTINLTRLKKGGSKSLKFDNWESMKEAYKGTVTKFVADNKPKYSPDIKKWFDNGGSIEINNSNGRQIWTYTSSSGESVPYIDGYVKFPDEYLNPTIKFIDIGEFTGDRGKDIDKMLVILEEDYGLTEIPDGYIVHHDIENGILQLVEENIHAQFTHIGGHSIYK